MLNTCPRTMLRPRGPGARASRMPQAALTTPKRGSLNVCMRHEGRPVTCQRERTQLAASRAFAVVPN